MRPRQTVVSSRWHGPLGLLYAVMALAQVGSGPRWGVACCAFTAGRFLTLWGEAP